MSNKNLFMKFGYLRAPFALGIGRYVCQLQRITIKFCKSHGGSLGVRHFLENDLINYAKENPGVVVYVKPRRHRNPIIKAEYLNGEVHWMCVGNYSREDVIQWMELMKTQYHNGSEYRLLRMWHTDFPSIQEPWSPYTFKDPAFNTAKLPDKKLGEYVKLEPTATEQLINLFKDQQKAAKLQEEDEIQGTVG
ncbi:39S ribosomal protein L43, mitochondrial [Habropoda laboriosa]|uniref:Large ribosomal subunit protein mL43 n=1 Tax=Habropoda laboriosa TaxID=597456 RepID=A0A0L7QVH9_9HYME|nr:PREDICTED: 39S ribosomal protein L43, mitochondrial [Habropoda laboriosa]KOC62642.1 39S ribosomal protein L43, mitochondrial [Habropoda laboriosa]